VISTAEISLRPCAARNVPAANAKVLCFIIPVAGYFSAGFGALYMLRVQSALTPVVAGTKMSTKQTPADYLAIQDKNKTTWVRKHELSLDVLVIGLCERHQQNRTVVRTEEVWIGRVSWKARKASRSSSMQSYGVKERNVQVTPTYTLESAGVDHSWRERSLGSSGA
jgi:hypothetical protein